jgi:hypothetical protein
MLMLPVLTDSAVANHRFRDLSFTRDERLRLNCVKATAAAERQLFALNQPCTDHQSCRRLAFALWLYATGRLSEDTVR